MLRNLAQEEWRDIKDYESLYQISNLGRVKSLERFVAGRNFPEIIRKPQLTRFGYLSIRLYKNNKGKNYKIHRLVAEAFISNPDNKPCIDHINAIRTDNRIENLRWVTHVENMNNPIFKRKKSEAEKQRMADPQRRLNMSIKLKERHKDPAFAKSIYDATHSPKSIEKLRNNVKNKPVACYDEKGMILGKYRSIKEASRQLGIHVVSIARWLKGTRSNRQGHKWVYI